MSFHVISASLWLPIKKRFSVQHFQQRVYVCFDERKNTNIIGSEVFLHVSLREKCPCSELFCSTFCWICTEYGEILRISPYSFQIWENADQNNSEYGHFLGSVFFNFRENKFSYFVKTVDVKKLFNDSLKLDKIM